MNPVQFLGLALCVAGAALVAGAIGHDGIPVSHTTAALIVGAIVWFGGVCLGLFVK